MTGAVFLPVSKEDDVWLRARKTTKEEVQRL